MAYLSGAGLSGALHDPRRFVAPFGGRSNGEILPAPITKSTVSRTWNQKKAGDAKEKPRRAKKSQGAGPQREKAARKASRSRKR
jgi:hypothetical protein